MSEIVRVMPLKDYFLEVTLSNQCRIVFSLKSKLITARFSPLRDRDLFALVSCDGAMLYWDSLVSLSLDEIFEIMRM